MNHWKKSLFTAAALVAALPLARGQPAPVATRAWSADAPAASDASASADRAYLGVYPGTNAEGGGVKLEQVVDGSPAAKAGLQAGDVITALGDRTVGSDEELREAIASHQSGEKVRVTFLREGEKRRTSARLGKAPSETDAGGGEVGTVTERTAEKAEKAAQAEKATKVDQEKAAKAAKSEKTAKADQEKAAKAAKEKVAKAEKAAAGGGIVEGERAKEGDDSGYMGVMLAPAGDGRTSVSSVVDGSPAQKGGLQAGDVILSIDGEAAATTDDLVGLVKKHHAGDRVTVAIERDGKPQKFKVKLAARSTANLGAGVGGMAAPVEVKPEPKAAETAVAPTAKARARVVKPAAGEGASGGGDPAMRKEVEAMRAELDAMRKSMEELKVRCESQQKTIEKIRRALDGNDEPGSFSYGGTIAVPAGAPATVVNLPSDIGLPSELATTDPAAVAVPDGGVFQIEAAQGETPIILHLEDSDQKIELEGLGPQIQAIVQKHEGDGAVLRVKPKVEGNVIELEVVAEGDEGCCGAVVCEDGTPETRTIVVQGVPANSAKRIQLAPHGSVAAQDGSHHQQQAFVVDSTGRATAIASGMRGVVVHGQGAPANGGGCCCCCQQQAVFHGDLAMQHSGMGGHAGMGMGGHAGMGMSGHPGMGGHAGMGMGGHPGTATFEVLPPDAPHPGQRPARAHMPGVPGKPTPPPARNSPMKFEFKAPQAQSFPQFAGGGTIVWKCDGPCELTLSAAGAQFRCEGSCEISQTAGVADFADFAGFDGGTADLAIEDFGNADFVELEDGSATLMFAAGDDAEETEGEEECCEEGKCCEEEGSGCCEESNDSDDEEHEDGDDDEHEDGDEDDDDDDDDDVSTPAAASIALPAI